MEAVIFFNDEPVAVYVDGVYVARLSMSTADLLDIDNVQVFTRSSGNSLRAKLDRRRHSDHKQCALFPERG